MIFAFSFLTASILPPRLDSRSTRILLVSMLASFLTPVSALAAMDEVLITFCLSSLIISRCSKSLLAHEFIVYVMMIFNLQSHSFIFGNYNVEFCLQTGIKRRQLTHRCCTTTLGYGNQRRSWRKQQLWQHRFEKSLVDTGARAFPHIPLPCALWNYSATFAAPM